MARTCTICSHADREAIDEAIVGSESNRSIAARFDVSTGAVQRHKDAHVSAALHAVVVERGEEHARSLMERVEALLSDAEGFLATAKASNNVTQGLAAIRECRAVLELLGKASGELKDGPTVQVVNLQTSAEWQQVRGVILRALEGHPVARAEVTTALLELGPGS
jgi:hypothetical protein